MTFIDHCHVAKAGAPANMINGASFFTGLTLGFSGACQAISKYTF
jgi:hypothetical protein